MRRLFLIGVAWVVLTGTCTAVEPLNQGNKYDEGKLNNSADKIELVTDKSVDKASDLSRVLQSMEQVQLNLSRTLIQQNDEIIRQNDKTIQQNDEIIRQNDEMIRLLRKLKTFFVAGD